jgi:hypothetical protein
MAATKTNKMSCGRCAMHTHDVNVMVLVRIHDVDAMAQIQEAVKILPAIAARM